MNGTGRPGAKPELLAPAGGPDAGYAALQYGADAVYLGLSRYSARAEAENFTPGQLAEFVVFAHSLSPRRKTYLALNTVIGQAEIGEAAEMLAIAYDCGVDAVIVQDLGILRLIRKKFPGIGIHASTQMAIHNLSGARAAAALGCGRITLARELTLAEIAEIAAGTEAEIEVFIHGTLCYSYSGLCFFSSFAAGRSGNRGRCAYSCREAAATSAGSVHPFSLKDLALGKRVLDLVRAGAASLKIEGRKKSPLYVAAATDFYRRILDGRMSPENLAAAEAGLKTVFARSWTRFFLDGRRNPDVADPEMVGHRGSPLGNVERLFHTPAGPGIRFRPRLPLERHDGCQIDVPGLPQPFGFAVSNLYSTGGRRLKAVFAVPAGMEAVLVLPEDAPPVSVGLPLYLSSSQAVKRAYPLVRPRPGGVGPEIPVHVEIALFRLGDGGGRAWMACRGRTGDADFVLEAEAMASPARDAEGAEAAARLAFSRLGGKRFVLTGWAFRNPDRLFVRPSEWNRLRRDWLAGLENLLSARDARRRKELSRFAAGNGNAAFSSPTPGGNGCPWILFVDDPACLADFTTADFSRAAEVIVGIEHASGFSGSECLERLAGRVGREKLRLALPVIRRDDPERLLDPWIGGGWRRWLLPGLAGLPALLGVAGIDLAGDWTLPMFNRLAAEQLAELGFSRLTLSPEDGEANWLALLQTCPVRLWAPAYTDVPFFISAVPVRTHTGHCRSGRGCPGRKDGLVLEMERSGKVTIWPRPDGGATVVGGQPFSLGDRLERIRLAGCGGFRFDLRWRPYAPGEAIALWRRAVSGKLPAGMTGNLLRGLA
ncbi:MAG: U32 family peptidase [Planctomycetota bacterium]|jgi:putative protease|nr:U32 family peptidase [Planctomycetota bacterium]